MSSILPMAMRRESTFERSPWLRRASRAASVWGMPLPWVPGNHFRVSQLTSISPPGQRMKASQGLSVTPWKNRPLA